MLRIVTLALVVVFAGPGTALAGDILESAERLASAIVLTTQPNVQDCAEAARAGTSDAQLRQGSAGWFFLGWALPVIAPLVVSDSQPPADTILQYDAELGRCYAASYSDRAKRKKRKAAWIGSGVGIGAFVALVALAASQSTYNYR